MKSSYSFGKYKLVFILIVLVFLSLYHIQYNNTVIFTKKNNKMPKLKNLNNLKYILVWTKSSSYQSWHAFTSMRDGQRVFFDKNCTYTNCYVTIHRNYFPNITKFDVIVFPAPVVRKYKRYMLPFRRAPHQKYVLSSMESSAYFSMLWDGFDGYFNWTWTYKLDSDSVRSYIIVRDLNNTVIGPNKIMHWINHEKMQPVSEDLKKILRGKTKTAAWFVSNCVSRGKRENYVEQLQKVLQSKYNTTVDVYGKCGKFKCSKNKTECDAILRRDYYFYLSFENSFSEDYVTEKLLRPLRFNALPIVYGGANYSRFVPEKSYINARELKPEELADKMNALMSNFEEYVDYFRWTNHYHYYGIGDSPETDINCSVCKLLNDESRMKEKKVYTDFRHWWNQ